MAGAQSTAPTLLASEVEFIAGEEAIEVLPAVTLGTLHLIAVGGGCRSSQRLDTF